MPGSRFVLEPTKHGCIGRLMGEGTLNAEKGYYDRPVMMVYAGKFDSMDGEVEITGKKLAGIVANYNKRQAALKEGEQWDPSSYAPLQLDHSTSARDTIGRVIGPLEIADEMVDGKKVKVLKGTARFLGNENIEKAKDGRYTHVSIGADLENEELNELSVTPFPAAIHAKLLSAKRHLAELPGKHVDEGKWNEAKDAAKKQYPDKSESDDSFWKIVTTIYENMGGRFSAPPKQGDTMDKEKLKKYLMEGKKMSAEDADKELSRLEADEKKEEREKLAAEADEHEKKLADAGAGPGKPGTQEMAQGTGKDDPGAASKHGELQARMTKAKGDFVGLAKGALKVRKDSQLATRLSGIKMRMAKLSMEAKLSPAHASKMDVAKLAMKSDAELDSFFEAIELSNPLIQTGQRGSQKAINASEVTSEVRLKALELETRLNMDSTRQAALAEIEQLKKDGKIHLARLAEPGTAIHIDTTPHVHEDYHMATEVMKHLEEGKHDEAKEKLKGLLGYMQAKHMEGATGESQSPDKQVSGGATGPAQMSALVEHNKHLQAQVDELVKFMSAHLGVDAKELE